jgi:DNA-binding NtrC family response regulator
MKLVEKKLETRVNEAFTRVAVELLPDELRQDDLTVWLLNTLASKKVDAPQRFPALGFEVNWSVVIASVTRHSFYFNTHFYLTALLRIGRLWRVSELAIESAEKALEPHNLRQTVLTNMQSYRPVLVEMNIAPDHQHTFLSDSIREIISVARSQHVVRISNAKRLWRAWRNEVQEFRTLADRCSDEFLYQVDEGKSLTSVPQIVHDVISFSFADRGTINALLNDELEAGITEVSDVVAELVRFVEEQNRPRILVVDDDKKTSDLISELLAARGYDVESASSGKEALDKLDSIGHQLVICDLQLPDLSGEEILDRLREKRPSSQVIAMTADGRMANIVQAVNHGAADFLVKPISEDDLGIAVTAAEARLPRKVMGKANVPDVDDIIATSPSMRQIVKYVDTVGPTNATVLIMGESGTGKEMIARAIHHRSQRADHSFVAINCAAVPEGLLESELFGHEKGAFTSAAARRLGLFEQASGGTIFLDEVENIPLDLQPKLLRILEEQEIKPLGSSRSLRVDVRVVAAANSDLIQLVEERKFRSDLYYRLSVFPITLMPLRERREDIPGLVEHFLKTSAHTMAVPLPKISPAALMKLVNYDWPGNVRELRNTIERLVILYSGKEIKPADLPFSIRSNVETELGDVEEFFRPISPTLDQIERRVIENALRRAGGNKRTAATILGMSRNVLYNKLKKYGLRARPLDSKI